MGLHWQDLKVAATIRTLIDGGYLSRFSAYAPDIPDLSNVKTVAGDYAEAGLESVMSDNKLVASVVETWLEKGGNRPTLCFGVNRAHAERLQEQFIRAGVSAGYCDAYTDIVERQHLERQFRAGDVRVACSVRTLTTGVDWPVSCIIDAAPTKSEMLHVQKIGRGLRVNPGTEDLIILDHASNSIRLGLVTDIYHDNLDATAKGQAQRKAKAERLPKECANCGALHTGLVCYVCGHERKPVHGVETVNGDLIEITKSLAPTKADKQLWWSALLAIRLERGYQKGWASHKYKQRFGVWPKGLDDVPGPVPQEVRNYITAKLIAFAKRRAA